MEFPTSIPPPVSSVPSLGLDAIVLWPPSTPHLPPPPPNEQQGFMAPPPPKRPRLLLHPPQEEEEAASPMMIASTRLPAAFVPNMPPASFSTMRPPRPPPPTTAPNQVLFKTRLCQKFRATGSCPYGDSCSFAHGPEDLRQPPPNWQEITRTQKICRKFYAGEVCPYGEKCLYAHVRRDGSVVAPADRLHPSQISGGLGSAVGSHASNRSIPRSSNSKPLYNRENTGTHTNEERRISAHDSSGKTSGTL
ncbi:hypothetical protein BHM03_00010199 [Ensete ventricosum]|nr:hypothetical protein BHM03_00010199 [Ensete ventricosum]